MGNIRSVVTEEQDTAAYPVASLETATINNEKIYYSGLDNGIVNKSSVSGYPTNDTYTNPNNFIQKLSGSTTGTKIGAGILLKVMSGDKINVHTSSWYKLDGATPDNPVNPLSDIVSALTASVPAASGGKILQAQLTTTVLNPSVNGFLNTRDATANTARPNAWLNIIVFDEQMNLVNTNDGKNTYYEQVGGGNTSTVKQYNISQREITKSGYVYIYVSNETPNVYTYWDNLQVTHIKGPLLQEEGYYPFGLEMKAISSQAFVIAISAKQSYKFNGGTELNESFDVDYYETYFRNYDAQIGRFTGVDAMAEKNNFQSAYQFANNNPIMFNDPTGLDAALDWVMGSPHDGQQMPGAVGMTPNGPPIDGGGGINDYGGNGGGSGSDYSAFWENLWNNAPEGVTTYINVPGSSNTSIRYEYTNESGDGVFTTSNYHGLESFTEGENYHFTGTEVALDFSSAPGAKGGPNEGVTPTVGIGLSWGEHTMFNKNTWYSIGTWKTYNQTFNGNGYTFGKLKVAKPISHVFKYSGKTLGAWNAYSIGTNDELSRDQKIVEESSNLVATIASPVFSIGWTIGWESGRAITQIPWYRQNIRPNIQDFFGIERDEYPDMSILENLDTR